MSFQTDLQRFADSTVADYIKLKRLASFDLFAAIVIATPVDKGTLRNNWFVTIGRGSDATTEQADSTGSSAIDRMERLLKQTNLDQDNFMTNNLPYAERIEFDGHSGKAPHGMVRVNTARWPQIVNVNLRRL